MRKFLSLFTAILVAVSVMADAHTYTVAGSSETAFGTTWDPTNAANDMTPVEGIYAWEKAGLELAAGELKFKVCQDHDWAVSYPAQDYVLNLAESGTYTLTITYNPDGNAVNAEAQKTGDAVVIPTVAMHGNFGGSNWADTENFTVAEGNETASLTLNLAAGNYEFGMRIGGSGNWTANGVAFARENNSAVIVAGQGNLSLAADAAGEYTFTWTYATNTLSIAFPEGGEPVQTPKFYITGESLVGSWAPNALPSYENTYVFENLAVGEYVFKITVDGTWQTAKGFTDLTAQTPGVLQAQADDNIYFNLVEAGDVTITYDAENFTVTGNFYVEPEQVKHYLLVGDSEIANGENWNENAEVNLFTTTDEGLTYTLVVEGAQLQGPHTYEFKIVEQGTWTEYFPRQYGANAGLYIEESGVYTLTYTYTVATQNCVVGVEKTGDLDQELENGYYLVGTMNEWTPAAENLFELNSENEAEYQLAINLEENDEVKVVYVENDAIVTWYPAEGDNYVIDHNHAGGTTMYFRPEYNGGDDWFAACIYVVPTDHVGVDNIDANASAVKVLRDGQIMIIRGELIYTPMGQIIK